MNLLSRFESKAKKWVKAKWKYLVAFIGIIVGLTLAIASAVYGFIAAYAKETVLRSLIEAEASVLGFFGIIIVYALTSLDAETNRLEQQLFARALWS